MQLVYKAIGRVASQDVTVLICGESGTGKEFVVRMIHEQSARAKGPAARRSPKRPSAGTTTPPAEGAMVVDNAGNSSGNSSKRSTRNFELDKTISHTRLASGEIRRLSVAVVLDDKQTTNDQGETTREPWKPEELAKFTTLVKEAIGFNVQRGDSVQVSW